MKKADIPVVNPVIQVSNMKIVIDRIENEIAVCNLENNSVVNVPAVIFENAKEGAVYDIVLDSKEQQRREEKAKKSLNVLFDKE